jgi:hypothetical protein
MFQRFLRTSGVIALVAASFFAVGCGDDDNDDVTDPGDVGIALMRFVHVSPDAPALDVAFNGTVAVEGVAHLEATDYQQVPAGDVQITVTMAGQTAPVIDTTIPVGVGAYYTIAATGLVAAGDVQPLVLVDDDTTTGQAKVRFVHATPDAPVVDVALVDGPVLIGGVAFRAASQYASVDGGTYDLEIRLSGTTTVVLPLTGITVNGSTNYTVFTTGLVADSSFDVLPLIDAQ